MKNKVLVVDDVDLQVWELTSNVPHVSKPIAVVSAILNFAVAGSGTLVAACAAGENVSKTQMVVAMFQFLTSFFLVGWLLAQYWSYLIVKKSWTLDDLRNLSKNVTSPSMKNMQNELRNGGFNNINSR